MRRQLEYKAIYLVFITKRSALNYERMKLNNMYLSYTVRQFSNLTKQ